MPTPAFLDTNVVLYLLSAGLAKADRAEELVSAGGHVSVQVLNDFVAVARRKLKLDWHLIEETLAAVRAMCTVHPLTLTTHELGLRLVHQHQLAICDAMIVAAALEARCERLQSEDMHDGLLVDGRLRIANPFKAGPA